MAASTSADFETSALRKIASEPSSWTIRRVSLPPLSATSTSTSRAPSRAKIFAVARPIPEPAPVMRATLLSNRPAIFDLSHSIASKQLRRCQERFSSAAPANESAAPRLHQYFRMLLRRGERRERSGHSFDAHLPGDEWVAIDSALGQVAQRGLEFFARVPEDELDIQLFVGSHHRFDLVALHADAYDHQPRIGRCGSHDRID